MTAVLVITGGPDYAHDFAASSGALADIVLAGGHDVVVVGDVDAGAAMLPGGFGVIVINALRWQMSHDRYDHLRHQWAYSTTPATKQAITSFVADGGGLVGIHTASICFDDWPAWRDVLGGGWNWDRSSHPPLGHVTAITVAHAVHPVTAGLASLSLVDEVFGDMDLVAGCEVLMTARRTPDDTEQPVVWAHRYGRGRVVYDGFGHDAVSLADPDHAALIGRAIQWVTEGER